MNLGGQNDKQINCRVTKIGVDNHCSFEKCVVYQLLTNSKLKNDTTEGWHEKVES